MAVLLCADVGSLDEGIAARISRNALVFQGGGVIHFWLTWRSSVLALSLRNVSEGIELVEPFMASA